MWSRTPASLRSARGYPAALPVEPEELTDAEVQKLRALLLEHGDRLEESLRQGADGTKPVDLDEPIGRISRIDALAQREINEAGRRAQQQELASVKLALEAIEDGEYGMCKACDGPIGFRRLQARPFSTICIACQSERERR